MNLPVPSTATPPADSDPGPPPESLDDNEAIRVYEHARFLKYKAAASYLAGSTGGVFRGSMPWEAFSYYLGDLFQEAGSPTDPIERMLLEQIALAHHNIGRLQMESANAEMIASAKIYSDSAVRLMGEFRRTVLALKQYRATTPGQNLTLVQQQNVAENQQVAYVAAQEERPELEAEEKASNSELESKERIEHAPSTEFTAQSTASCGREKEPAKAKRVHARRA